MGRDARRNPFGGWKKRPGDGAGVPTTAFDRFGRELQAGDAVYLIGKQDAMWRMSEVTPVLEPGAPAGLVRLTFTSLFSTAVPGGVPVMDVIKIRDAEEFARQAGEQQPAAVADAVEPEGQQDPPPADPPPAPLTFPTPPVPPADLEGA